MPVECVGYRLTERCNASRVCKERCFSREGGVLFPDPQLDEVRLGLVTLKYAGLKAINFMGGEPTLRQDLPKVVRYAHQIGLETIVTTNTLLLSQETLDLLAPNLDWLSISIDADTPNVNNGLRGRGQLESAQRVIKLITQRQYLFHLKVNTQITAQNYTHIDRIPSFFMDRVDIWKLLQWTPRGDAQKVMDVYAITPQVYAQVVDRQKRLHPEVHIVERPYPEIDPDTIILRPGGDLEVNAGEHSYHVVGNIFSDRASDVLARAEMIYLNLAPANRQEHEASYPML